MARAARALRLRTEAGAHKRRERTSLGRSFEVNSSLFPASSLLALDTRAHECLSSAAERPPKPESVCSGRKSRLKARRANGLDQWLREACRGAASAGRPLLRPRASGLRALGLGGLRGRGAQGFGPRGCGAPGVEFSGSRAEGPRASFPWGSGLYAASELSSCSSRRLPGPAGHEAAFGTSEAFRPTMQPTRK